MAETEELRVILRTVADTSGARQTQQSLRGIQSQALAIGAVTAGFAVAQLAARAYLDVMQDSVEALRAHQKELRASIGQTAEMASGINALDKEFTKAEKSGKEFQVTLGRLFAPAELARIQGGRGAIEGVTTAIKDASRWAADLAKSHPWLFQAAASLPGVGAQLPQLAAAGQSLVDEEAARARAAAYLADKMARDRERHAARRMLELNDFVPQRETAAEAARVAFLDQLDAGVRDLVLMQQQSTDLQREAVQLTAQEASLRLSLLPAQERMLALQRDIAEQQIRARQAALPATEALEDLRYLQERSRLIARDRLATGEERSAARRQLRALGRAEPGVELAALEAGRGVTIAGRAAERAGLEAQLFDIATQRQLAGVQGAQGANVLAQAIVQGIVEGQRQLVQQMLDANRGPLNLNVTVTLPDGSVVSYKELLEAADQAGMPPAVKLSGVRR